MLRLKRIIAMVICTIFAITLCACGSGAGKNVASDSVKELTWFIRASEPEGFDEVLEAANVYLKDKMNIKLDLQCIEPGDYEQKAQLALASGEQVDIMWTSNWANQYQPNVAKNAFLALDEYLENSELSELKEYYSDGIWEATRVAGKIYGVPVEQVLYDQPGIMFSAAIAERNNVTDAIYSMESIDDLEEIYSAVRAGESEDVVITANTYQHFKPYYSKVSGYYVENGEVVKDPFDELGYAKRMRSWNEMRFFPKDIATFTDEEAMIGEEKIFGSYDRYLPGVEGKNELYYGYDTICLPTGEAVLSREGVQSTLFALPMTCSDPVTALKFINLMLHDEYLLNLICYGIEGRDFTIIEGTNPKRMERDAGGYYIAEYVVGSQFLAYLSPEYDDGVWEETRKANEEARVDDYIGFSFDPEPVESEISQVSAASREYTTILGYGLEADVESVYYEKEKKLDLAGRQVVIDEINRQIKAWQDEQ